MWNKLLGHLVQRALPVHFADPEQERTAEEAAECGIRYAVTLIGIPVLIVWVGVTAVFSGFQLIPTSHPAPLPDAVQTARELGMENARLRVAYRDIQGERDALIARVAELETRTTHESARRPEPQRARSLPFPKRLSAKSPSAKKSLAAAKKPSAAPREKPLDQEGVRPQPGSDTLRCADGRIARATAECPEPSLVPAAPGIEARDSPPALVEVSAQPEVQSPSPSPSPSVSGQQTSARSQQTSVIKQHTQPIAPDPPTNR